MGKTYRANDEFGKSKNHAKGQRRAKKTKDKNFINGRVGVGSYGDYKYKPSEDSLEYHESFA